jgi:hypothetical protein
MRGFTVTRDRARALSLSFALTIFAIGLSGCALETTTGDPSATTEDASSANPDQSEAEKSPQSASAIITPAVKPEPLRSGRRVHTEGNPEPIPWNQSTH